MKHWLIRIVKILLWTVLVVAFLNIVTLADNNSLAISPNWFSGNKNSCSNVCSYAVDYSNIGFPIQIDSSTIHGPYWLAWVINLTFAGIFGLGLAWIIIKKPKIGILISTALIICFLALFLGS